MDTKSPAHTTLPHSFRQLLWSFDFPAIDPIAAQKEIILQTVNYGTWEQWMWIARTYGKDGVARNIAFLPESSFRPQALRLARVVFNVPAMSYASRGAH
jgi:uncharacterized protein YqcC (DUF446 family)